MKIQPLTMIFPAILAAMITACGGAAAVKHDDIPTALRAPEGQQLLLKTHATGVQIYVCQPVKTDPARLEWAFKAPEADLAGRGGRSLGKHYAGPTWEGNDGSKVVGSPVAKESPDPNSIPWLLLTAKSTGGKGIFSEARSVQRLHTVGGTAPSGGCGATQLNQELRVSYSADYLFYR